MAISGEKLQAMQQEQFNATMRLANVAMANAQKMIALQAQAARALFEDSVAQAQAMTQAGSDPKALMETRTAAMQKSAQHVMEMSRQMAEALAGMHAEFQQMLSEHMQSSGARMLEGVQAMFGGMPAMPGDAAKMFEQAIATMRGAFEEMTGAAQGAMGQMMKGGQSVANPPEKTPSAPGTQKKTKAQ